MPTFITKITGEFKHEVRQFEKSYDNQQAEQIS
ncbi:pilus assembly protein, partial [Acinetobacter baumannii]|nr:pilus assembly protein [Acinetobacter baumannii]